MAQKITQALIYDEIKNLRGDVQAIKITLEGTEAAPGLKIRLDRLEQKEHSKTRGFGYVWTAITALAAGLGLKWVS